MLVCVSQADELHDPTLAGRQKEQPQHVQAPLPGLLALSNAVLLTVCG